MMRFHHIGIATKDVKRGIEQIQKIYNTVTASEIIFDENQNATLCFIRTNNGIDIELIAGEMVSGLVKRGIQYYHICYTVSDIYKDIENMKKNGAIVISEPKPAKLFDNKKVAFLYTDMGLIELLEDYE